MADEQTNIGQIKPQQVPQQAPQAPQQAPQQVPSQAPPQPPANAQAIIQAQQDAMQRQIQEAQARDRAMFGAAAPGLEAQPAPALGGALIQGAQQQAAQPPAAAVIGNAPGGLSAQQLAAGIPQQAAGAPQQGMTPQQQQIAQLQSQIAAMQGQGQPQPNVQAQPGHVQGQAAFAQHNPQSAPQKPTIRWHPGRNSDLKIELTDVIIAGIPDTIQGEPDPQAKIVAAMFSEILTLRARLDNIEQNGMASAGPDENTNRRITMLEMTLTQQTQSLTQGARAAREEATRQLLAEQQKNAGQPGGTPVVDPSLNPVAIQAQPAPQPQAVPAGGNGDTGSTG